MSSNYNTNSFVRSNEFLFDCIDKNRFDLINVRLNVFVILSNVDGQFVPFRVFSIG
jgi:hypothetical protein